MTFKAMKFWIGDDPKLSEKVQKLLFELGYLWVGETTVKVENTKENALYASSSGKITYSNTEEFYEEQPEEEINIDWLRTPKQETIELNGKRYDKSELACEIGEQAVAQLEEALKHINPVE